MPFSTSACMLMSSLKFKAFQSTAWLAQSAHTHKYSLNAALT